MIKKENPPEPSAAKVMDGVPSEDKPENDKILDFDKLREKAAQPEQTAKKPRKPRAKKKLAIEEIQVSKTDLKPFFIVMNMILASAKITPLSKEEIEVGVESWFPVYQKYAKYLIGWSIWIPPLTWTTGVYISRKPELDMRKAEYQEIQEQEKQEK